MEDAFRSGIALDHPFERRHWHDGSELQSSHNRPESISIFEGNILAEAAAGAAGAAMDRLRAIGIAAEQAMLTATGGVNTHRGAIFGLGLLAAAAGFRQAYGIRRTLGAIIAERWGPAILSGPASLHSHGANAARRYGAGGARAEAAQGLPSVYEIALPALRTGRAAACGEEAARVHCLHGPDRFRRRYQSPASGWRGGVDLRTGTSRDFPPGRRRCLRTGRFGRPRSTRPSRPAISALAVAPTCWPWRCSSIGGRHHAKLCFVAGRDCCPRTLFDLVGDRPEAAAIFEEATQLLGDDPRDLVHGNSDDRLADNHMSQILTVTSTLTIYPCIQDILPSQFAVAGYSVGEMAAWSIAGVWTTETALRLTDERARAMNAAGEFPAAGWAIFADCAGQWCSVWLNSIIAPSPSSIQAISS